MRAAGLLAATPGSREGAPTRHRVSGAGSVPQGRAQGGGTARRAHLTGGKPMESTVATSRSAGLSTMPSATTRQPSFTTGKKMNSMMSWSLSLGGLLGSCAHPATAKRVKRSGSSKRWGVRLDQERVRRVARRATSVRGWAWALKLLTLSRPADCTACWMMGATSGSGLARRLASYCEGGRQEQHSRRTHAIQSLAPRTQAPKRSLYSSTTRRRLRGVPSHPRQRRRVHEARPGALTCSWAPDEAQQDELNPETVFTDPSVRPAAPRLGPTKCLCAWPRARTMPALARV